MEISYFLMELSRQFCHASESWHLENILKIKFDLKDWIPAYAGMTEQNLFPKSHRPHGNACMFKSLIRKTYLIGIMTYA